MSGRRNRGPHRRGGKTIDRFGGTARRAIVTARFARRSCPGRRKKRDCSTRASKAVLAFDPRSSKTKKHRLPLRRSARDLSTPATSLPCATQQCSARITRRSRKRRKRERGAAAAGGSMTLSLLRRQSPGRTKARSPGAAGAWFCWTRDRGQPAKWTSFWPPGRPADPLARKRRSRARGRFQRKRPANYTDQYSRQLGVQAPLHRGRDATVLQSPRLDQRRRLRPHPERRCYSRTAILHAVTC